MPTERTRRIDLNQDASASREWTYQGMRFFSPRIEVGGVSNADVLPYAETRAVANAWAASTIALSPFESLAVDVLKQVLQYLYDHPTALARVAQTSRHLFKAVTQSEMLDLDDNADTRAWFPFLQVIYEARENAKIERAEIGAKRAQLVTAGVASEFFNELESAAAETEDTSSAASPLLAEASFDQVDKSITHIQNRQEFQMFSRRQKCCCWCCQKGAIKTVFMLPIVLIISLLPAVLSVWFLIEQKKENPDRTDLAYSASVFFALVGLGCGFGAWLNTRVCMHDTSQKLEYYQRNIREAVFEDNESHSDDSKVVELDEFDVEANSSDADIGDDAAGRVTIELDSDPSSDGPGAGADAGASSLRLGSSN